LINLISGLLPCDAGQVLFDGQTIQETTIILCFPEYRDALFPWLRAIDNIRYPLKLTGLSRRECDMRVEQLLADFDVKNRSKFVPLPALRRPAADRLDSAGARHQSRSSVLDEPFSALDYEMTLFMREQLAAQSS